MSMIEKQLQDLESLKGFIILKCNDNATCEEVRKPLRVLDSAINTIKTLSAKVADENIERNSQYYNGGWIPVDERLPEPSETSRYLVCMSGGGIFITTGKGIRHSKVIAWRPLPELYKGE